MVTARNVHVVRVGQLARNHRQQDLQAVEAP